MAMKDKGYLSIGEFSSRTGKSVETLRVWDRLGKLKPAYRNEESKYRYYTEDQVKEVLNREKSSNPYNSQMLNKLDSMFKLLHQVNSKVSEDKESTKDSNLTLVDKFDDLIDGISNLPESDDRDLALIRVRESYLLLKREGVLEEDNNSKHPEPIS